MNKPSTTCYDFATDYVPKGNTANDSYYKTSAELIFSALTGSSMPNQR